MHSLFVLCALLLQKVRGALCSIWRASAFNLSFVCCFQKTFVVILFEREKMHTHTQECKSRRVSIKSCAFARAAKQKFFFFILFFVCVFESEQQQQHKSTRPEANNKLARALLLINWQSKRASSEGEREAKRSAQEKKDTHTKRQ